MYPHINRYTSNLKAALDHDAINIVQELALALQQAWEHGRYIYICGNGGSAANAVHIANDLIYGAGVNKGTGLKVEALSANPAVLTCLGNDIGYENIFSQQLRVKANPEDILIVLSGSGNSQNIVNALHAGKELGMKSFAILGYSGGRCREIADTPIHFPIDDMQISEDLQLIVGHICMQWLCENPA